MIVPEADVLSMASDMIGSLDKAMQKDGRLGKLQRYLRGDHDLPYAPKGARQEYKVLAKKSITNWLPLIADTYSKVLFVDGYRAATAKDNDAAWLHWQANGLDARQSIAHRAALEYSVGYVLVLPSDSDSPSIRPLHPTRVWAEYEDEDDDFPAVALVRRGKLPDGKTRIFELFDDEHVYTIHRKDNDGPVLAGPPAVHGFGHIPLVRFRDRLDGDNVGIISPLINIQDRINEAVFSLMIAIQYASFRQRWATGLAIPRDENQHLPDGTTPNPNFGKPIEPFQAAVDRLWVTDNHEAKFGDFSQTDVRGHLDSYQSAVRTLAAIAQTPPHVLLGDLVNLSADALAAAESSTQRKAEEYATIFGESWELVLSLAAIAAGNDAPSEDAQIRWRDTEARSLAQTVDALGKMVQMLSVPAEGAWERIPGVTDADIKRWKEMGSTPGGLQMLAEALTRQNAPVAAVEPAPAAEPQPPAAA